MPGHPDLARNGGRGCRGGECREDPDAVRIEERGRLLGAPNDVNRIARGRNGLAKW